MKTTRLEAFSDGVLAILITIMVLELRMPGGSDFGSLIEVIPFFLTYVISFVYLGIYWNNHHHMIHTLLRPTGGILWANLHLLFWLSLIPVATGWLGGHLFAEVPTAFYGFILFMSATAYFILQRTIIRDQGPDSVLARSVGRDWKGKLSLLAYGIAIAAAFTWPQVSAALYILVAVLWLIPDPRIERTLRTASEP